MQNMPRDSSSDRSAARAAARPFSRISVIAAALLAGSAGCQAPPAPDGPTEMVLHVADYETFVDSTLTLLREFDFMPERVDRHSGRIVTAPTTGGQWFEFWRGDVRGPYQLFESSLHTIRRRVSIGIASAAGAESPNAEQQEGEPDEAREAGRAGEYRVTVQVDKTRYSAPERQVTTASGALGIYSERLPTTEGLRNARSVGEHWVPLGRDGPLETYLLSRIAALSGARPAASDTADEASEPTVDGGS